jgi:GNAT superfamily N-acetyltransferase
MVVIERVDPESPDAQWCLSEFVVTLTERFPAGFDPGRSAPAAPELFRPPTGAFLVAYLHGEPVGCGALKTDGSGVGEIKRMWVAGSARGHGLGRRLLVALEEEARARGMRELRLETNGTLVEARGLYESAGYASISRFGDDPYAQHWFGKSL